jgi:tetratricopeptide (TPR) repeat protein
MNPSPLSNPEQGQVSELFERLNQAEPFVGIRLAILGAGIGLALYWFGGPTGPVPETFDSFPMQLVGVYNEQSLIAFGYPVREVIWSGEWWRLAVGVLLPVGFFWFAFSLIAFIPLAKVIELELSRGLALLIYLAGGATAIAVDYFSSSQVTGGSLGMVFSAAGAVLAKGLLDYRRGSGSMSAVTSSTWMALLLLLFVSGTMSVYPLYLLWPPDSSGISPISPTHHALVAAFMTGLCFSFPFLKQRASLSQFSTVSGFGSSLSQPRAAYLIPVIWGLTLTGYLAFLLQTSTWVDYRIWSLEPRIAAGDRQAQAELAALVRSHPNDLFAAKRLAVSFALNGQWDEASKQLKSLEESPQIEEAMESAMGDYFLRRSRLARLNRRSADRVGPWRRSSLSLNYEVETRRLLWDRAHVARLRGATDELSRIRTKLMENLKGKVLRKAKLPENGKDDSKEASKLLEALVLNENAYVQAELGGDLAQAAKDASASVSLAPDANNLDTLGWIETKRGHGEKGIQLLEKALLYHEPRSKGTLFFHLGHAFEATGDHEKARKNFSAALRYDLEWWEERGIARQCPECLAEELALTDGGDRGI